jgi:hypothetical protein
MANWVTHLMIADHVMKQCPELDRHKFCVGNIAPDCNIENDDWTSYTPSRKITHWMSGERKIASDCDNFFNEYIIKRKNGINSREEYSFLLGYYSHLITDATFESYLHDETRLLNVWERINANEKYRERAKNYSVNWNSVKEIVSREDRMNEINFIEAQYLRDNPNSGYLTEIIPLNEFPDYIDYMPHGCIIRKIGVMGYLPKPDIKNINLISISSEEYSYCISVSVSLVADKFKIIKPLLETLFLL